MVERLRVGRDVARADEGGEAARLLGPMEPLADPDQPDARPALLLHE